MIGFGSIGRGVLPLIERHIGFDRAQFTVIEPSGEFAHLLQERGIRHLQVALTADQAILAVLTLIDLSLAANLLLIVLFSGYENFVSKFDFDTGADRPAWMGKVDFSGLKMKLIASIVAISGIHLLKLFMSLGKPDAAYSATPETMRWMVIIHLTFVASGVLLALMDWLTSLSKEH